MKKNFMVRNALLSTLAFASASIASEQLRAEDPPQSTKTQVVVVSSDNHSTENVMKMLREQLKDLPEEQRDKILAQVEKSLEQAKKGHHAHGSENHGKSEQTTVTKTQTVVVNAESLGKANADGQPKVVKGHRIMVVPKSADAKDGKSDDKQTTLTVTVVDGDKEGEGKKVQGFKILEGGKIEGMMPLVVQGNALEGGQFAFQIAENVEDLEELKKRIPKMLQEKLLDGQVREVQLAAQGPSYRIGLAIEQSMKEEGDDKRNEGLVVERVVEDSPAAQAGIKEGDVIVSINGEKAAAFSNLQEAVQAAGKADEAIKLVVVRDSMESTVKVKPTKVEDKEGALNFFMAPQAGSIVSGDDIAGMKSGVFSFGVPLLPTLNANAEAGAASAAGIAAMLPGAAATGELKSEIESLRNEVSELKGMIKKLLKKVAEEHDEDEDEDEGEDEGDGERKDSDEKADK